MLKCSLFGEVAQIFDAMGIAPQTAFRLGLISSAERFPLSTVGSDKRRARTIELARAVNGNDFLP